MVSEIPSTTTEVRYCQKRWMNLCDWFLLVTKHQKLVVWGKRWAVNWPSKNRLSKLSWANGVTYVSLIHNKCLLARIEPFLPLYISDYSMANSTSVSQCLRRVLHNSLIVHCHLVNNLLVMLPVVGAAYSVKLKEIYLLDLSCDTWIKLKSVARIETWWTKHKMWAAWATAQVEFHVSW